MANEFYSPGEQRAAKVSELFSRIAPRYDLINDVQSFGLHRLWKRRLVRLARVQSGERALDLCCGTGDLAFALANAGATVTGLDFSEAMLRVAGEKSKVQSLKSLRLHSTSAGREDRSPQSTSLRSEAAARKSVHSPQSTVEFVQGDAQRIPFPDNTFDIVTIGYGLRNLADLDAGIREMLRVCKPGGRLLALDFGKPENALWRAVYFSYLKTFLPVFGKIFCGSAAAYAYILESLIHYPAQQGVSGRMREAGWQNVRVTNLLAGVMSIHWAEKRQ